MTFSSTIFNRRSTLGGFTLIELLVVVAIIGLLAAITVTAIFSARDKARNTRIQADLSQIRAQATLVKNDTDSYSSLCDASNTLCGDSIACPDNNFTPQLKMIEDDVRNFSGNYPTCYGDTDAYCVQSQLVPSGSGSYCVDFTGYAGTTQISCDLYNHTCADD
jgi:prepilin-type N-terminal cleavage/methylation domain-containing protein